MMNHLSIAIDGPSGAGKSTLARMLARQLGFLYIDTGAIYRAVGLYIWRRGDTKSAETVSGLLGEIQLSIDHKEGVQRVILCGEDVSEAIRQPEISLAASDVSAHPEVRAFLLDMQREFASCNNVIMDGRDIGTVVLPDASLKIFLTASANKRAERRYRELILKGIDVTYDQVLSDLNRRDENDKNREAAPLRPADDAVILDTTELNLEESLEAISELAGKYLNLGGAGNEVGV